jgi:hypothetical protein
MHNPLPSWRPVNTPFNAPGIIAADLGGRHQLRKPTDCTGE